MYIQTRFVYSLFAVNISQSKRLIYICIATKLCLMLSSYVSKMFNVRGQCWGVKLFIEPSSVSFDHSPFGTFSPSQLGIWPWLKVSVGDVDGVIFICDPKRKNCHPPTMQPPTVEPLVPKKKTQKKKIYHSDHRRPLSPKNKGKMPAK